MNFARDLLEAQPGERRALVELARDGTRREWTFEEVERASGRMAGALASRGVRRGDVVMTLIGNRPEWVFTMMACFRIGAVALPCTEQLRAKDLGLRLRVASPQLIVADVRDRRELDAALQVARPNCGVVWVTDEALLGEDGAPPSHANLEEADPCLIAFTSGTAGEPKAVVHGVRYLYGQRVQAEHWLGAREGELVWCTAASGWSKSARNVFIAPWLMGATALLHDARFDPHERLELIERERVAVLCMAPTEYRVIAKRATLRALPSLRGMVAAGEALNPEVLHVWRQATGLEIRDGYGQTETGQMTGMPSGTPARAGSMGRALPGMKLSVLADRRSRGSSIGGELVADPTTVPTFFLGYLGEGARRLVDGRWQIEDRRAGGNPPDKGSPAGECRCDDGAWEIEDRREGGLWRTGDRVRQGDDGYLFFEGRDDDVIISAGYRIGPFEVESALVAHPAVAEAAAVAAPDEERGAVVRAVVVLRGGHAPSDTLARELQEHVKRETAPYKYPRIVEFVGELPKTSSGKIRRAQLRG